MWIVALSWLAGIGQAEPLTLDAVLEAVDAHQPALQAAAAKIEAAEAKLMAARGAFDPALAGKANVYGGSDPRSYGQIYFGGETPLGPSWQAGIRRSDGYLKPYETELETGEDGEWFARVEVPLDQLVLPDSRAQAELAGLGVDVTERAFDDKRLDLRYKASAAYWKWVGVGAKLEVERDLLRLADERLTALGREVEEGSAPEMDRLDAERAQLERQARVVAAEADLGAASQRLALYYRGDDGAPSPPGADQLPELPAPGPLPSLDALLARAMGRPDLMALDRGLEAARVALRRAQLALIPDLTVAGQAAEDLALGKTELLIGAELKAPLLMRKDRGKLAAAQAEVSRLEAERRWLADQIVAELESAWLAADAARGQAELIAETAARASEVMDMERIRYELGEGDLFKLLLREDKLAEVRKYLAAARAEAQLRLAALERAAGGSAVSAQAVD